MDGAELVDAVRAEMTTELARLGSEKALVALTHGRLDADHILATVAAGERRVEDTFRQWANDEDHDTAAATFTEVADSATDHWQALATQMDREPDENVEVDMVHEHLRDLDRTPERIGAGLIGRPLASARTLSQVVAYFENESGAATDVVRTVRTETDALTETGAELLDQVCESDEEWERAREAAEDAIQVADDEYAGTLRGLGLNP